MREVAFEGSPNIWVKGLGQVDAEKVSKQSQERGTGRSVCLGESCQLFSMCE